ncbi:DoxX family protein [Streptomyces xinghaiensis]|uniref:DoxX family protein n=1 Tax=Streptomyces xinghaiensis TaxID=1038928 RepID=UPI001EDD8BD4|nr:DoxX family protein [Streptomyces xinghaiensis]
MSALRWIARPLLASFFVYSGVNTIRNAEAVAPAAENVVGPITERLNLPLENTEQAVRLNSAVHIAAGTLLGLGKFPRLSALALAGSLVPTTLAGHRFWEAEDPEEKSRQQMQFLKNVSLLGGLLAAAADIGDRPSLNWRAHHAAHTARREMNLVRRTATAAGKRPRVKRVVPALPVKTRAKGTSRGTAKAAAKTLRATTAPVKTGATATSAAASKAVRGTTATVKPQVKAASKAASATASRTASAASGTASRTASAASKALSGAATGMKGRLTPGGTTRRTGALRGLRERGPLASRTSRTSRVSWTSPFSRSSRSSRATLPPLPSLPSLPSRTSRSSRPFKPSAPSRNGHGGRDGVARMDPQALRKLVGTGH